MSRSLKFATEYLAAIGENVNHIVVHSHASDCAFGRRKDSSNATILVGNLNARLGSNVKVAKSVEKRTITFDLSAIRRVV